MIDEASKFGYDNELAMNISMQDIINICSECEDRNLTELKNALAWYAGEEVARDFRNLMECKEDIYQNHLKTAETKLTKYTDNKILKLTR